MFPVWGSTSEEAEQQPTSPSNEPGVVSYVPEEPPVVSTTETVEPQAGTGTLSATTPWYSQPAVVQPEAVAQPQPAMPVPTAEEIAASTTPQPDAVPSVAPPPPEEFLAPAEPTEQSTEPVEAEEAEAEEAVEAAAAQPPSPSEEDELKEFANKMGVSDGYLATDVPDEDLLEDTDKYYSTAKAAAFFPGRKGDKGKSNQWLYWGLREGIFTDLDGNRIEPLRVGKGQRRRFSLDVIREIALSCYRRGNLTEDELKMVLRKILIAKHGEEAFD